MKGRCPQLGSITQHGRGGVGTEEDGDGLAEEFEGFVMPLSGSEDKTLVLRLVSGGGDLKEEGRVAGDLLGNVEPGLERGVIERKCRDRLGGETQGGEGGVLRTKGGNAEAHEEAGEELSNAAFH